MFFIDMFLIKRRAILIMTMSGLKYSISLSVWLFINIEVSDEEDELFNRFHSFFM